MCSCESQWSVSTTALSTLIVQFNVPSYPARLDYFMVADEAALHLDQFLEVILRNSKKHSCRCAMWLMSRAEVIPMFALTPCFMMSLA